MILASGATQTFLLASFSMQVHSCPVAEVMGVTMGWFEQQKLLRTRSVRFGCLSCGKTLGPNESIVSAGT